jgi:hypothetical protein
VQIQGTLGSEEPSGDGIRVYRNTWKIGGFSGRKHTPQSRASASSTVTSTNNAAALSGRARDVDPPPPASTLTLRDLARFCFGSPPPPGHPLPDRFAERSFDAESCKAAMSEWSGPLFLALCARLSQPPLFSGLDWIGTWEVTLGTKYREPSTEPNLPRIEPNLPKPKNSVPCSVPSSQEPNLPR